MRLAARMLVLCFLIGITAVSAHAASYLVLNGSNEAFTAVFAYTDNTSEEVSIGTAAVQIVGIGTKIVSSVTINGQAASAGSVNYPVTLPSGNRAYVTVLLTQVIITTAPVE